jgi:hypothetical protein
VVSWHDSMSFLLTRTFLVQEKVTSSPLMSSPQVGDSQVTLALSSRSRWTSHWSSLRRSGALITMPVIWYEMKMVVSAPWSLHPLAQSWLCAEMMRKRILLNMRENFMLPPCVYYSNCCSNTKPAEAGWCLIRCNFRA